MFSHLHPSSTYSHKLMWKALSKQCNSKTTFLTFLFAFLLFLYVLFSLFRSLRRKEAFFLPANMSKRYVREMYERQVENNSTKKLLLYKKVSNENLIMKNLTLLQKLKDHRMKNKLNFRLWEIWRILELNHIYIAPPTNDRKFLKLESFWPLRAANKWKLWHYGQAGQDSRSKSIIYQYRKTLALTFIFWLSTSKPWGKLYSFLNFVSWRTMDYIKNNLHLMFRIKVYLTTTLDANHTMCNALWCVVLKRGGNFLTLKKNNI